MEGYLRQSIYSIFHFPYQDGFVLSRHREIIDDHDNDDEDQDKDKDEAKFDHKMTMKSTMTTHDEE